MLALFPAHCSTGFTELQALPSFCYVWLIAETIDTNPARLWDSGPLAYVVKDDGLFSNLPLSGVRAADLAIASSIACGVLGA